MDGFAAELEIVRQHLRQAEARLRRLEALTAKGRYYQSARLMANLMDNMHHSVELARDHVARVEAKRAAKRPLALPSIHPPVSLP